MSYKTFHVISPSCLFFVSHDMSLLRELSTLQLSCWCLLSFTHVAMRNCQASQQSHVSSVRHVRRYAKLLVGKTRLCCANVFLCPVFCVRNFCCTCLGTQHDSPGCTAQHGSLRGLTTELTSGFGPHNSHASVQQRRPSKMMT
jgi:hypothetical protein